MEKFQKELEDLINKHSVENGSDTPDFILAEYLTNCLKAFNSATIGRTLWHQSDAIENSGEIIDINYEQYVGDSK